MSRPAIEVLIGTCPEAMLLAPVISALHGRTREVELRLLLAGSDPDRLLRLLPGTGCPAGIEAQVVTRDTSAGMFGHGRDVDPLRRALRASRPDLLLVPGDSGAASYGSLAAFLEGIPVARIDAASRVRPAERGTQAELLRLGGALADIHLTRSRASRDALIASGVRSDRILLVQGGAPAGAWDESSATRAALLLLELLTGRIPAAADH